MSAYSDLYLRYVSGPDLKPGEFCIHEQTGDFVQFRALARINDQKTALVEWFHGTSAAPKVNKYGSDNTVFRVEPGNYSGLARAGLVLTNVPEHLAKLWRRAQSK